MTLRQGDAQLVGGGTVCTDGYATEHSCRSVAEPPETPEPKGRRKRRRSAPQGAPDGADGDAAPGDTPQPDGDADGESEGG